MTPASPMIKAAELTSGLGAIVLGAGLALLWPDLLRAHAEILLLVGLVVHGSGMTLKYRLQTHERGPLSWERALFWLCWAMLIGLIVWLPAEELIR